LHNVALVMFHVGEWTWELIICLLEVLKNEFCELAEAMIQVVERPWELIFCITDIQKIELDNIAEVIFKQANGPVNSLSAFWTS
jgi:hypothetical protein